MREGAARGLGYLGDKETLQQLIGLLKDEESSGRQAAAEALGIMGDARAIKPPEHLDRITICVLTLRNGYTIVGTSACASPENFDATIGRKIARQNATQQIWPLLGYVLRSVLNAEQP